MPHVGIGNGVAVTATVEAIFLGLLGVIHWTMEWTTDFVVNLMMNLVLNCLIMCLLILMMFEK